MSGAILIGTGPSLNRIDLMQLARFPGITFNRAYLAWSSWPFAPRYYACLDKELLPQIIGEIAPFLESASTHFFLHEIVANFGVEPRGNLSLVKLRGGQSFSTDLRELTDFGNVGATSMQLLALLGYRRILLVGVDARYSAPSVDKFDATETGRPDPDHFLPNYRRGIKFDTVSDRAAITTGWSMVARECARIGLLVSNSPGSNLDCFPIRDLHSALQWLDE